MDLNGTTLDAEIQAIMQGMNNLELQRAFAEVTAKMRQAWRFGEVRFSRYGAVMVLSPIGGEGPGRGDIFTGIDLRTGEVRRDWRRASFETAK